MRALGTATWAAEQKPVIQQPVQADEPHPHPGGRHARQHAVHGHRQKGRFVTDLTKDDFEVIESKKPQSIQEFTAESDLPLRLAVLIDTSNSIRERFKFEQEAASEFLNSVDPRQSGQRHGGELRHLGRTGSRSGRRHREAATSDPRACVRAAARRSTTPSFLPAATSCRRTSRSTSSAARL